VGGAAEFLVKGGAPTVGAVGKVTERGVLPMGCFGGRTEEGKRTEAWRHCFEAEVSEVGEGWGVRARRREGGRRGGVGMGRCMERMMEEGVSDRPAGHAAGWGGR
jgi:hypothetical protein